MLPPRPFLEWNPAEVTVRGAVRGGLVTAAAGARSGCLGELDKEAFRMLLNAFS